MTEHGVVFVPMQQSDLQILQQWFTDEELRQRLGGMLPLQQYFDYVQSEPDYFSWMVVEGEIPVGAAFLQIETDAPQSCAFMVKPELRNRGYGRLIMQMLMARPEVASVRHWSLGIEPNNIASQRCVLAAGFALEQEKPDGEGFLHYELTETIG